MPPSAAGTDPVLSPQSLPPSTYIADDTSLTGKLRLGEVRWPAQEHMAVRDKSELSLSHVVSTHDQATEGGDEEMQDKSK